MSKKAKADRGRSGPSKSKKTSRREAEERVTAETVAAVGTRAERGSTATANGAPALAAGVPALGPAPRLVKPRLAERILDNGLRVVAVRQPGVPLIELRLRIPFAATGSAHPARSSVLADTLLTGTATHSQVEIAEILQASGAELGVGVDADRLMVSGNLLRTGLRSVLDVVADVVTAAAYPAHEVAGERDRLADRITMARTQPDVLAREALDRRIYGSHPYGFELPDVEAVRRVTPASLRTLHRRLVVPAGATLVLVGDLSPARAIGTVERALTDWTGDAGDAVVADIPAIEPGPTLIVDRPGSVQSSIRLGGPAIGRADPAYPGLQLANLIYGGYFSSRLTENIREDKGYTYSPISRISHAPGGSTLVTQADVATEVTAPALVEIGYELGRISTLPVTVDELDAVRQYAVGSLTLSVATQSGLASTLSALSGVGLDIEWLREHPARLAAVTREQVAEQAARFLRPSGSVTVVLGDAATIAEQVGALGPVELSAGPIEGARQIEGAVR